MGSIFGDGGSETVDLTNRQVFELPAWVSEGGRNVFEEARRLAQRGYPSYSGTRVAPFSPDQNTAFDRTRGNLGAWQPAFEAAMSGGRASATPIADADIQRYLNPYTDAVLDPTLSRMLDQYRADTNTRHGDWAQRGSYLNEDRRDLIDARAGELHNRAIGEVAGNLNYQGFNTALGAAGDQKNREFATSQFMAQLAPLLQQLGLGDAASLEAIGGTQQAQAQRVADVGYGEHMAEFLYPQEQQSWLTSILSGIPTNHTTTTTGQQLVPQSNAAGGFLGGLASIAGLGNNFGLWGPGTGGLGALFGSSAAAGLPAAAGFPAASGAFMLSSKEAKTRTGEADEVLPALADLPIQKWTYKPGLGDPAEHVGPYAEDFANAFGLGDGKTIHLADMAGVLLKGMQEINARLDAAA
jgi:hypothetical protein